MASGAFEPSRCAQFNKCSHLCLFEWSSHQFSVKQTANVGARQIRNWNAPVELSESQTRALLINPLLTNAEWKLSDRTQVGFEIPVAGYDPNPWNGITDYCLYRSSGPA